jgi:MFS family permease
MGQAMGYVAAATSIGSLAGPLLGGVVYASAGYYAVFAMGFAVIGLDIVLRLSMIEKSVAEQWTSTDESVTTADPSDEKKCDPSNEDADRSRPEITPPTELEQTIPEDIEPLPKWTQRLPPVITLLRVPRILVSLLGCFVQSNSLGAFDSVLPLFVKDTFHWTSTGAGLIFICLVVPALFSPIVGIVSDKFGSRSITTTGLLGAVPFWVLMRLVTYDSIGQKALLCALLFFIGTCMTFVMAPLMADLDHAVELEGKKRPDSFGKRGAAAQGFGLFNFAYAVGSLIGPLWAGFVVNKYGFGTMGWSLGILSGICAVATFIWTGGRIMLKDNKRRSTTVV